MNNPTPKPPVTPSPTVPTPAPVSEPPPTPTPDLSPEPTPESSPLADPIPSNDSHEGATDEKVGDRTGPGAGSNNEATQVKDKGGVASS